LIVVLIGGASAAFHLTGSFATFWAGSLVSPVLWDRVVGFLGGSIRTSPQTPPTLVGGEVMAAAIVGLSLVAWLAGGGLLVALRRRSFEQALWDWAVRGWSWWGLLGLFEVASLFALSGIESLTLLLQAVLVFVHGLAWGGWLGGFVGLLFEPTTPTESPPGTTAPRTTAPPGTPSTTPDRWRSAPLLAVLCGVVIHTVVFGLMNQRLYENLLLPHGDSAMYEEHLWNLLHGKGFRSYLDGGRLFLGEHVQVIHLAFIPIYVIWPSHVLLEWGQSLALAVGAIPVFWLAKRHSGSASAAALLAIAYLLYFPMQSLDIAIDLKTFRPNAFEIPLFLFAFDALERRRWTVFGTCLVGTLLCQEDAAPIIAPLGLWLLVRGDVGVPRGSWPPVDLAALSRERTRIRWLGLGLMLGGVAYVFLVTQVVLPYFRGGADVHYAQYFSGLGNSSKEIAATVLTRPGLVFGRLFDLESLVFGLGLLVPLVFLPVLSPGRLLIAAPLFGVLCLNEISKRPVHHFHAPLVPVVFWSAAVGLGVWPRLIARLTEARETTGVDSPTTTAAVSHRAVLAAATALGCAWGTGLFTTFGPLGLGFWDSGSPAWWRRLYVINERAELFPKVLALIPPTARVASTDFVHPRFTHHERSYDYSDYRPIVPPDAEFIVIDTRHPYSAIRSPADVKELKQNPDDWELLPDETRGYYIVLKRRSKPETKPETKPTPPRSTTP
jgi:uncharacterized membrane protein